jgi:hypothetical protein
VRYGITVEEWNERRDELLTRWTSRRGSAAADAQ